jgi:hypothetical protein
MECGLTPEDEAQIKSLTFFHPSNEVLLFKRESNTCTL